jgi:hypothetical protein
LDSFTVKNPDVHQVGDGYWLYTVSALEIDGVVRAYYSGRPSGSPATTNVYTLTQIEGLFLEKRPFWKRQAKTQRRSVTRKPVLARPGLPPPTAGFFALKS